MTTKPTKPTVPPAPSRSNPGVDFANKADVFAAFQAPFATYMDEIADFVDQMADDALAAAVGGDLPPLTGQGGKLLAVKDDETGAEFVDDTIGALTTNGLITRTGAGTAAARTLTAGTGITITNGDGVAGDPVVAAVIASQAEAEAGTNSTKLMTPERVAQAVAAQAPAVSGAIGIGQTWQDVLGSRSPGTSYQNTTGKPIMVAIDHTTSGGFPTVQVSANNSTWITIHTMTGGSVRVGTQFIVPPNWYYRVSSGPIYSNWTELR